MLLGIDLLAVSVAAVANMIVGFVWYSPLVIGKPWMRARGYDQDKKKQPAAGANQVQTYGLSFVASLVTAFVLATTITAFAISTITNAALLGFAIWVGFVLTTMVVHELYSDQPRFGLLAMDAGYHLVGLPVMAVVLFLLS